jgi:hypothetical protein
MSDTQRREKIKRFLSDAVMAASVKEAIRETFLRPRAKLDVQVLAAERLAIDLLEDAWKEMEKYKTSDGGEGSERTQRGL